MIRQKTFWKKTLVNSVQRFWQNLDQSSKQLIYGTNQAQANFITRAIEAIQLEFIGECRLLKDPATVIKYAKALQILQLCDMYEEIHLRFSRLFLSYL